MNLSPGTLLGHYEIRSLLGTGGNQIGAVTITPDGKSYAYTAKSSAGTLYLVEGVK